MHIMLSVCTKRNFQTDVQIREHFNKLTVVLGNMPASRVWGRPRTGRTPQLEEVILHAGEEDPSVSTRQLSLTRNVDLRRMLCENLLCTLTIYYT